MAEHKRLIRRKKQHGDDEQLQHNKKQQTDNTTQTPLQLTRNMQVTPKNALQLQRTLGNAAVQRMVIQREGGNTPASTEVDENANANNIVAGTKNLPPTPDIGTIWQHNRLRSAFIAWLKHSHADENIQIYDAITHFRNNPHVAVARKLLNTYLTPDAPKQFNTSIKNVNAIYLAFEQAKLRGRNMLDTNIFDQIAGEAEVIMIDPLTNVHSNIKTADAHGAGTIKNLKLEYQFGLVDAGLLNAADVPEYGGQQSKPKQSFFSGIKGLFGGLFGKKNP